MTKLGNQFIIIISENKSFTYTDITLAAKKLNNCAFKLYLYFNFFRAGEIVQFFPSLFCNDFNVSMSSEKRAFQELVENSYLKYIDDDTYMFFNIHDE